MIDQQRFKSLVHLARQWALAQEALILQYGSPLRPSQIDDAQRVGVKNVERVRVLLVDRIPMPDDGQLAEAARRAHIITEASQTVTFGHGIVIRADAWQNRETLIHALVHVAQCERSGGLDSFIEEYLSDRATCADFSVGGLENEARQLARAICTGEMAAR